jgi:inorganic triphosphatase YgiF
MGVQDPADTYSPDEVNAKPREIELKLEMEPGADQALLHHPLLQGRVGDAQHTVSVYYDTARKLLRQAGITLRVRRVGERFIQTVKSGATAAAGLFDRLEWETPIVGPEPELDQATPHLALLSSSDLRGKLRPVFTTLVDRRTAVIEREGARIELVIDRGEVVAGDRRQALLELELELIEGTPAALFDLARELQANAPLRLGVLSKSERGERLASGKNMRALKAEPVRLDNMMDASTAFQVIAFACLRHFRSNEPLVIAARDPDALHQSRVALRRLRSALSLFRPILKGPALERFKVDLRGLALTLGRARNLDVLLARRTDHLPKNMRQLLVEERCNAYESAIAALRMPATTAMLIDLTEWIALGERHNPEVALGRVGEFSQQVLDRFWKKVKKPAARVRDLHDEDRHELRIAGKKLRYAGEFFAALHGDDERRDGRDAFLTELEQLQDHLGALNDIATEQALQGELAGLGIELPAVSPDERREIRRTLLDQSAHAAQQLTAVGPYWRP